MVMKAQRQKEQDEKERIDEEERIKEAEIRKQQQLEELARMEEEERQAAILVRKQEEEAAEEEARRKIAEQDLKRQQLQKEEEEKCKQMAALNEVEADSPSTPSAEGEVQIHVQKANARKTALTNMANQMASRFAKKCATCGTKGCTKHKNDNLSSDDDSSSETDSD